MKLIAIVPARIGSKRLPNKNFRSFMGKSMIMWPVSEIIKSEIFDMIVVSTDEDPHRFISKNTVIESRSEYLASDTATVDEVCLDILSKYRGYDYLCVVYPTAYAIMWQDLNKAFLEMQTNYADSCHSCGMLNGDYELDNGGFYYSKIETFMESKKLINGTIYRYNMEQVDINTLEDFIMAKKHAETLVRRGFGNIFGNI